MALLHAGQQVDRLRARQHEQLRQRGAADAGPDVQLAALHRERRGRRYRAPARQAQRSEAAGTDYLPSPSDDYNLDFYPTVNPISAGGYFWAYFTSRRSYGNLYAKGSGRRGQQVDLGERDRHQPGAGRRSEPPRLLPARPGARQRQHPRVRRSRSLRGRRRDLRERPRLLRRYVHVGQVRRARGVRHARTTSARPACPCCDSSDMCIGGYCGVAPPK